MDLEELNRNIRVISRARKLDRQRERERERGGGGGERKVEMK